MRLLRVVAVLSCTLLLAACGLSEQQKADLAAVQRSGVNAAVYDKMTHGDDLSLYDIVALTKARVNPGVILRYMRNQQTIYTLNAGDVQRLANAGVDQSIIDYMLATPQMYRPVPVVVGVAPYPYWGYPYPPYPYPYYYRYRCP